MWKNRITGILGLFIALLPFLGFSFEIHRALMIVFGLVIAILSFWSAVSSKNVSESPPYVNNDV